MSSSRQIFFVFHIRYSVFLISLPRLHQCFISSLVIRTDYSYSLLLFAQTSHAIFGASSRFLILSLAFHADSSYSLWRFAQLLILSFATPHPFFGASRLFSSLFSNPPHTLKPDFQLFQTLCTIQATQVPVFF